MPRAAAIPALPSNAEETDIGRWTSGCRPSSCPAAEFTRPASLSKRHQSRLAPRRHHHISPLALSPDRGHEARSCARSRACTAAEPAHPRPPAPQPAPEHPRTPGPPPPLGHRLPPEPLPPLLVPCAGDPAPAGTPSPADACSLPPAGASPLRPGPTSLRSSASASPGAGASGQFRSSRGCLPVVQAGNHYR